MNPNSGSPIDFSGFRFWLTLFLVLTFFSWIGWGWVLNGFVILFILLLVTPTLAFVGLRWWLNFKRVDDSCPVCGYEFTAFKGANCNCPSCGEPLQVTNGRFNRLTPPGTIDVEAIEVPVKSMDN